VATSKTDRMRKKRRKMRVRSHVAKGSSGRLRISLFRSLNHIYGQIIDDANHVTLASASSLQLDCGGASKREIARRVGLELAKRAKQKGIETGVFDRGPYLYHGRIKEFAEGLREGGMQL
jgi:large subunit ribosomal protein L18